jgi:hypothetical protein
VSADAPIIGAVSELISAISRDGRPVVRLRCSDYGTDWVVECDVYPVGELSVQPKSAGPYVFEAAEEARAFVDSSLQALERSRFRSATTQ